MSVSPSITRSFRSKALGKNLLMREWLPVGPTRGCALVLHGLGDHSGRHDWAAGLIIKAGLRAVGFDWPGNGESEGVRGDMPTMVEADALLEEFLETFHLDPVGVFAHSTGAFLAVSWLARHSRDLRALRSLRWVWMSSPLIRPSHGQPRLKIALAQALARHFPRMTLGTGVRARDCYHTGIDPFADASFNRAGGHHRISLRFATDLLAVEGRLLDEATRIRPDLAFLLTQGSEDPVCRPEYAEELFHRLPGGRKTCLLASGSRHEPFREPDHEAVTNAVAAWLDRRGIEVLLPNGTH